MKKLVILGHGTGGTIIATKMRQKLPESQRGITVIDRVSGILPGPWSN